MKFHSEGEFTALNWVKPALDATTTLAREALEQYVEAPETLAPMRECVAHLHQVQGTLRMVELYGAAMVVENMERLAEGLVDGSVRQREEAYSVLMRGMVQLPDYLERLQSGHKDIPIVLLPLLNDLRACRGEGLLSESALFSPDLAAALPGSAAGAPQALAAAERRTQALRLRLAYQAALLKWFRDEGAGEHLDRMIDVLDRLRRISHDENARRLWWVAAGTIEAVRDGGIASSVAVKLLFGRVDREINRFAAEGDDGFAAAPPRELTKNLLYYIAHSSSDGAGMRGPRCSELIRQYRLDLLLPTDVELQHAQGSMTGRNKNLLGTVSSAIKEDLLRVKEALDIFLRSHSGDPAELAAQGEMLRRVGDTLGMLGLGVPRRVVEEQRKVLEEMTLSQRPVDEGALLDVAGALLYVEASLDDHIERLGDADTDGSGESEGLDLPQAEVRRILDALMRESAVNIVQAKQDIIAFIESPWDHARVSQIPHLLEEIAGALRMLTLPDAAELMAALVRFVEVELLAHRRIPTAEQMDKLADAFAAIEYYLEATREQRRHRDRILDIARDSLQALGYWPLANAPAKPQSEAPIAFADVRPPMPEPDASDAPTRTEAISHLQVLPGSDLHDLVVGDTVSIEAPQHEVAGLRFAETGDADGAASAATEQWIEVEEEVEEEVPADDSFLPGFQAAAGEEIDDSIREIFTEEVEEEVASLREQMPAWKRDIENLDHLKSVRRSFHTLKGSGRLVGARALGEFSWKIESLLNRVLDGTSRADNNTVELVDEAVAVVPAFLAALRGEQVGSARADAIADVAERLIAGESATLPPATAQTRIVRRKVRRLVPAPAASTGGLPEMSAPVGEAEVRSQPAHIDPVLFDILQSEVAAHLGAIEDYLARCENYPVLASEPLTRAVHTLNGAIAMVEIPAIGNVLSPLEQYVNRLRSAAVAPEAEGLVALRETVSLTRDVMARLSAGETDLPASSELASRILALRDSLPEPEAPHVYDFSADLPEPEESEAAQPEVEPLAIDTSSLSSVDLVDDAAEPDFDTILREIEAERRDGELTDIPLGNPRTDFLAETPVGDEADGGIDIDLDEISLMMEGDTLSDSTFAVSSDFTLPMDEALEDSTDEPLDASGLHDAFVLEESNLTEIDLDGIETIELEDFPPTEPLDEAPAAAAAFIHETPVVHETPVETEIVPEWRSAAPESIEFETPSPAAFVDATAEDAPAEAEVEPEPQPTETAFVADVADTPDTPTADSTQPQEAAQEPAVASVPMTLSGAPAPELADDVHPEGRLDADDIDADLLDIFVQEGRDILDQADALVAQLRAMPHERAAISGLQRELHTLKGGARMAGLAPIGDLSHAMESLVDALAEGRHVVDRTAVEALERGFDRLHGLVQRISQRRAIAMPVRAIHWFESLVAGNPELASQPLAAAVETVAEPHDASVSEPAVVAKAPAEPIEAKAARPAPRHLGGADDDSAHAGPDIIRVRSDLLDTLVNAAGEVSIYRSRLEQQVATFRFNLVELDQTVSRLRDQLRKLEIETEAQIIARYQREQHDTGHGVFDPLELDRFSQLQQLSRALSESVSDLVSIQGILDDQTRQSETLLLQQSRVNSELQEGLMRTRMVPFDSLVPNLRRTLRQAAQETGRRVQLKVEGTQGEMDRNLLERMKAPLEHMLRNALAHGIETPEERLAKGKSAEGTVDIALSRESTEVVLRVADDGRGMDRDAIRRKAIDRGLLRADATPSDRDLYAFVLESGFSTASEVTQLSGRGVGMDVVHNEIKQLGGSLAIDSTPGRGTAFTVRLPFTLAVTQAILVKLGEVSYAIPMSSVQGVARISQDDLDNRLAAGDLKHNYAGEEYTIYDLAHLLGQPRVRNTDEAQVPLLMARSGDMRSAVRIDGVVGSREIVVKSVGPQLSSIPGIFGATIMGDGAVVIILDLAPLVRHVAMLRERIEVEGASHAPAWMRGDIEHAQDHRQKPLVMVVDDSITMRKVTSRVLERADMDVITAKDGLDALEKLQESVPDLMLLDIEMPRMDGYELATYMRNDARTKGVPIIMITSRTGEKHRQRALEIGVERYLGKPYQEEELLRQVHEILRQDNARH